MSVKGRLVVIDDEVNAAAALETLLKEDGYEVARAHDARTGLSLLEKTEPDVVLTDLRMPGMDGIELLAKIKEIRPETMVILMTAYGTVKTAVKAMKLGAEDYLSKPIDVEELEVVLQKALDRKGLVEEARSLRERLEHKYRLDNLVGESPEMLSVFKTIRQVAPSSASVLLLGESGTGKELFAQALHQNSPRRNKPFVKVACAALPETLLESELFGHEKGSFTGAVYTRAGPLRGGRRRHALPRRDRRHHADGAGEAAALPRGARVREGRRQQDLQGRRAHRGRDPPRPQEEARGGHLPRGPLLPAERHRDPHPAAARPAGRHPAPRPPLPAQVRGRERARTSRASRTTCSRCCWPTTGRATCASSRTRWSARWC